MAKYTFKQNDIEDFLVGLTIFGTGGGGEAEWGRVILNNEFKKGREMVIVDPEDVEDDAFVCSGGIMGSVKSLENISYEKISEDWEEFFPLVEAVKTIERLKGKKVDYLVPFEVGGLNTPVIMAAASRLGIPMINADGNGRSAPETQMISFIGHGISLYPMPLVDKENNVTVVMGSKSTTFADEVGRFIVVKSGGMGANAHYPMSGYEAKNYCIPYTVMNSVKVGRALRMANQQGVDPIKTFCETVSGHELFRGRISHLEGVDRGGFYLTDVQIDGTNNFTGSTGKLVVKNETMALWVNGEVKIIFPDCAFMLEPDSGNGIPSIDLVEGKELVIVGAAVHERIRVFLDTEIGKQSYGGSRYGYPDLAYVPFEKLNQF
jgi:DUF917 family protein